MGCMDRLEGQLGEVRATISRQMARLCSEYEHDRVRASRRAGVKHRPAAAALALCLAAVFGLTAGCGEQETVRISGTPEPDHAREVERNPYALTCRDLERQPLHPDSARLVIHAEFALAQEPALRKVVAKQTLNRTGRSVYYALTEICKAREPAFRPAEMAVEAVRQGRYRAARNRPG